MLIKHNGSILYLLLRVSHAGTTSIATNTAVHDFLSLKTFDESWKTHSILADVRMSF